MRGGTLVTWQPRAPRTMPELLWGMDKRRDGCVLQCCRYVLWPRIDQKTCLKAIVAAGLTPVPVPPRLEGDELATDVGALRDLIAKLGAPTVVCVVTTTSCFAPRGPDALVEVARLCAEAGVGHVVNNAYGVQSAALCALVRAPAATNASQAAAQGSAPCSSPTSPTCRHAEAERHQH